MMSILLSYGKLHFSRLAIEPSELPLLFEEFGRNSVPESQTRSIEDLASELRNGGYTADRSREFIRRVCNWGGYPGVAGRVFKRNDDDVLRAQLAFAESAAKIGDACGGLEALLKINGLGVSFASKHLKFLAPEQAVVLDSVISSRLGYPLSIRGYGEFLDDCQSLLLFVRQADTPYPGWGKDGWRISDVEMAIFAKLRCETGIGSETMSDSGVRTIDAKN